MKNLHIAVTDKIATYKQRDGIIVCGNSDYQIVFTFDDEWNDYTQKTARFIVNGTFTDVNFTGDTCPVPILTGTLEVSIGVYAGTLSTTTPAKIPCVESILCYGTEAQGFPLVTRGENGDSVFIRYSANADGTDFTEQWSGDEAYIGIATGQTAPTDKSGYVWCKFIGDGAGGSSEEIESRLTALETAIADLTYTAIAITSFSASPSTAEMGSTVSSVALSWGVNKTPSALTLDGSALTVSTKTVNVTGAFTANKTWTLKATDERGATSTRTASLTFLNGVYYGAAAEPSAYNSAFVLGLTKSLRSGKLTAFSANAGSGQYIYYCLPTRMGTCSFKVGGFDGGFSLIDTIEFTNASGYSENYYIYRSDNVSLGQTSVSVS